MHSAVNIRVMLSVTVHSRRTPNGIRSIRYAQRVPVKKLNMTMISRPTVRETTVFTAAEVMTTQPGKRTP